jgi:hypothetical protein
MSINVYVSLFPFLSALSLLEIYQSRYTPLSRCGDYEYETALSESSARNELYCKPPHNSPCTPWSLAEQETKIFHTAQIAHLKNAKKGEFPSNSPTPTLKSQLER